MEIRDNAPRNEMKAAAERMYDALFAHNYSRENHIGIGKLHFDEDTRKNFFAVLSSSPDTLV